MAGMAGPARGHRVDEEQWLSRVEGTWTAATWHGLFETGRDRAVLNELHGFMCHGVDAPEDLIVAVVEFEPSDDSGPLAQCGVRPGPACEKQAEGESDRGLAQRKHKGGPPNVWRQWRAKRVHCTPGLGTVARDDDCSARWRRGGERGRVVRSKEVDEAMLGEDAAEESGNSIGPKGEGGGKKVT